MPKHLTLTEHLARAIERKLTLMVGHVADEARAAFMERARGYLDALTDEWTKVVRESNRKLDDYRRDNPAAVPPKRLTPHEHAERLTPRERAELKPKGRNEKK